MALKTHFKSFFTKEIYHCFSMMVIHMEIRIMLGIVDQQRNDAMLKARNEQLREEAIIASGTYFRGKDGIVYRKSGPNGEPKKV